MEVEFESRPGGKPRLAGRLAGRGLTVNLSHSGDLALVAVARGDEIGVDVERHDAASAMRDVEDSILSAAEKRAVSVLPEPDRTACLRQVWTRKEAALKAVGWGLTVSPVDVHVGADPAVERLVGFASPERADVVVRDLACPKGYCASVAVTHGRGGAERAERALRQEGVAVDRGGE
jgi:4'-phosphopantetheinyl transferase